MNFSLFPNFPKPEKNFLNIFFFLFIIFSLIFFEYWFSWYNPSTLSSEATRRLGAFFENNALVRDIVLFVLTHIALQLAVVFFAFQSAKSLKHLLSIKINIWLLATCSYTLIKLYIYFRNSVYFPKSTLSFNLPELLNTDWFALFLNISLFICVLSPIFIMSILKLKRLKNNFPLFLQAGTLIAISLVIMLVTFEPPNETPPRTNVILIGIDSVSAEHIRKNLSLLPTFNRLMTSGVGFKNAVTPLARTFPAWSSLLSGTSPSQNGAVFNLVPIAKVDKGQLVKKFNDLGYKTIFAQDERRFSNIDESWGFDSIVGPKTGAVEFIFSQFADHPISNVLYDTKLGQTLFPYIALNRASHNTYSPTRFVNAIGSVLPESNKAVFLASHFCLAHIPFSWADSHGVPSHKTALIRLDKQVNQFLLLLKNKGLLQKAVVILFSDHGESVSGVQESYFATKKAFSGSRKNFHEKITKIMFSNILGHGINLNSRSQYNSFLHINQYPIKENSLTEIRNFVSIIQINTFISNIIKNKKASLFEVAQKSFNNKKPIPLETGLYISLLSQPEHVDFSKVVRKMVSSYEISNKGLLQLTDDATRFYSKQKQKGVILSNWLEISLNLNSKKIKVLVDLTTGDWTYDLDSPLARNAPLAEFDGLE